MQITNADVEALKNLKVREIGFLNIADLNYLTSYTFDHLVELVSREKLN